MRRRNVLESSSPTRHTSTLRFQAHELKKRRSWWRVLGTVMLLGLSLAWSTQESAATEQIGFTADCSGFAQDPLLQQFWPHTSTPDGAQHTAALTAMTPRLALRGTALATYAARQAMPTAPTLEAVFGMSHGIQRELVETTFSQEGRAVVLHPNILATVAHVLTPDVVEVQVAQQASVQTVPLRVTNLTVTARPTSDGQEVPVQIAHVNTPYDLALVQADENRLLQTLPYPTALSYGMGDPEKPAGGLQAGDCVAAIISVRDNKTPPNRLVLGKVLARVPVATNSLTQTKLNVNMFTTDLAVQPGDSGSPVLALRAGKPVLVGLVSATMFPNAIFTYVARLDPLLSLAETLRRADSRQNDPLLVRNPATPGHEPVHR